MYDLKLFLSVCQKLWSHCTRVYRSFGLDSDHYLVASKLSINKSRINSYRKPSNRLRVDRLKEESVASEFVAVLEEKFSGLNENVSDIESEWGIFKNTVLGAARECLGFVRNKNGKKKTDWWNNDIKAAVKEKRSKWMHWMPNRTEENWTSYKEQRDTAKRMVKEAKEGHWIKFGEELEEAGQQRNKVFWTKVKNIRNGGKKQAPTAVLDKSGNLVIGRNNVLNRWKEYFDDLLNVDNGVTGQNGQYGEENIIDGFVPEEISMAEIQAAIQRLKWGKAAGVDEIRTEFLLSGGVVG
ncbi:uncharacterized protein LOC116351343, partial [Contarinia nasturtii]|uniref:uncharacterized protein LOC116351343 n=1 Tax=Contarinia nasturtii TaxID=265458 RepID=UPI0012D3A785